MVGELSGSYSSLIASVFGVPLWAFVLLIVWSLTWKIPALWISARKRQLVWFIILIFINTAGILEILYIFIFSKIHARQAVKNPVKRKVKRKRR